MLCPSCHTQNRENAKFCKNCRSLLLADGNQDVQPVDASLAEHAPQDQPSMQSQDTQPIDIRNEQPAVDVQSPVANQPSMGAINQGPEGAINRAPTGDASAIEDISRAPTQILSPQEMMEYQARRWQQEVERERKEKVMDIADMQTLQMIPANGAADAASHPSSSAPPSAPPPPPPPESLAPAANVPSPYEQEAAEQAPNEQSVAPVVNVAASEDTSAVSREETNMEPVTSVTAADQETPAGNFPVLAVGTLVVGRFEITQVINATEQEHTYQVTDHQGYKYCWNCGSRENAEGDQFCINCGAELVNASYLMHEYPAIQEQNKEANVLQGAIVDTFVEQERTYVIEQPQALTSSFPSGVHLLAASASDAGDVRRSEPNEDSTLVLQLQRIHESISAPVGVFIVADGLGGHDNGQQASRMTINVIAERMVHELLLRPLSSEKAGETVKPLDEDELVALLQGAIEDANTALYQVNQRDKTDMGSTLTGFMVVEDHTYILNVGDSRTYMLRDGKLYRKTNDHSLVSQLVAGGLIEPDEVYTHPQRSQIFRSLGDKLNVQVDTFKQQILPGDTLLSCSDGLWEMVRDPQITDILNDAPDPQTACAQLVDAANKNGGEDNISAVVVMAR